MNGMRESFVEFCANSTFARYLYPYFAACHQSIHPSVAHIRANNQNWRRRHHQWKHIMGTRYIIFNFHISALFHQRAVVPSTPPWMRCAVMRTPAKPFSFAFYFSDESQQHMCVRLCCVRPKEMDCVRAVCVCVCVSLPFIYVHIFLHSDSPMHSGSVLYLSLYP